MQKLNINNCCFLKKGLCACVRCRCGLCRCKYAESKNANLRLVPNTNITMYQREYFDKSNDFKQNSGLFSIPFPNEKFQSKGFDYTTTHQVFFLINNL